MNKKNVSGKAIFGVILIAIGILSILNSINVLDMSVFFRRYWGLFFDSLWNYWPVLIIFFGVRAILNTKKNTILGIGLTVLGSMLLLDNLDLELLRHIDLYEMIIPIIVILIGLHFILQKQKVNELEGENSPESKGEAKSTKGTVPPTPTVVPAPPVPPTPPVAPTPPSSETIVKEETSEETEVSPNEEVSENKDDEVEKINGSDISIE